MRRKLFSQLWLCTGSVVLAGFALVDNAVAQSVTGNLTSSGVNYGQGTPTAGSPFSSQLTTQTINTSFGDSTYSASPGPEANGTELDAAYGTSSNGYLYIFLAGNLQDNGNILQVYIDDGRANGQNTLAVGTGG